MGLSDLIIAWCLQFDWDGDFPPRIPQKDLVIYEMHVRGFTKNSSSEMDYLGTYIGLVEKLSYLKVIVILQKDGTTYGANRARYFFKLRLVHIIESLDYFYSNLKTWLSWITEIFVSSIVFKYENFLRIARPGH